MSEPWYSGSFYLLLLIMRNWKENDKTTFWTVCCIPTPDRSTFISKRVETKRDPNHQHVILFVDFLNPHNPLKKTPDLHFYPSFVPTSRIAGRPTI